MFVTLQKQDEYNPVLTGTLLKSEIPGLEGAANHLYSDTVVPSVGNLLAYRKNVSASPVHVHADLNDFRNLRVAHGIKAAEDALRAFGWYSSEFAKEFGGTAYRYGSDEFRYLFKNSADAYGFVRKMRHQLEEHSPIGGTHALTACFGIGKDSSEAYVSLETAKAQLGSQDDTGARIPKYDAGMAPVVVHSMLDEVS